MARIEGKFPVMAYLQLLGGGLTVMVVSFSAFFWVTAAFRPERDPAAIQMLTDLGWLCIDLQYACTTLQMVAAALVGLGDKSKNPLFPRWVCFLTIWCGLSFLPASLTGVLKTVLVQHRESVHDQGCAPSHPHRRGSGPIGGHVRPSRTRLIDQDSLDVHLERCRRRQRPGRDVPGGGPAQAVAATRGGRYRTSAHAVRARPFRRGTRPCVGACHRPTL
jgi:hypothetical protein